MKLPALVLLAAFAAGMAGCCRRAAAPQFAERSLDTVVRCGAVPCDLSYRFLTIANADRSEALAAIENANVNYFFALEDFTGTAEEAARRFIERFAADNACDTLYMPDMRYSLSVAAAQAPVDTLTVYTIRRESYTGGAHGMYSVNCHNYSIAGGYELALSDLFDAARQEALIGLIRNKLYEQFGVTGDEGLVAQGFFPEYISTTENFEVTEDGITFYYNPYDIGCYALGGVEVHITREEMQGL